MICFDDIIALAYVAFHAQKAKHPAFFIDRVSKSKTMVLNHIKHVSVIHPTLLRHARPTLIIMTLLFLPKHFLRDGL